MFIWWEQGPRLASTLLYPYWPKVVLDTQYVLDNCLLSEWVSNSEQSLPCSWWGWSSAELTCFDFSSTYGTVLWALYTWYRLIFLLLKFQKQELYWLLGNCGIKCLFLKLGEMIEIWTWLQDTSLKESAGPLYKVVHTRGGAQGSRLNWLDQGDDYTQCWVLVLLLVFL